MAKYNRDEMWDILVDYLVCTPEELRLVTDICGYSEETMSDILYAREGYRDFEQFLEDVNM